MTNYLDRRLRRLEANSKAPDSGGRFRLVLVPAGGSPEAEIAKLGDMDPRDELCVVRFVRAGDPAAPAH